MWRNFAKCNVLPLFLLTKVIIYDNIRAVGGVFMKRRYEDGIVPHTNQQIRADIARQMREARHSMHLTQQVLADRVGTKKSNISRMESGTYNPTLDFMVKVAEGMGKQISIRIDEQGTDTI